MSTLSGGGSWREPIDRYWVRVDEAGDDELVRLLAQLESGEVSVAEVEEQLEQGPEAGR